MDRPKSIRPSVTAVLQHRSILAHHLRQREIETTIQTPGTLNLLIFSQRVEIASAPTELCFIVRLSGEWVYSPPPDYKIVWIATTRISQAWCLATGLASKLFAYSGVNTLNGVSDERFSPSCFRRVDKNISVWSVVPYGTADDLNSRLPMANLLPNASSIS